MSDSSSYYYKVGRYYYEVIPGKKFDTRSHTHLWDPIRYRFIFYRKNGKQIPFMRVHPSCFPTESGWLE